MTLTEARRELKPLGLGVGAERTGRNEWSAYALSWPWWAPFPAPIRTATGRTRKEAVLSLVEQTRVAARRKEQEG